MKHVVVIGAGIIGLATALRLREDGHRVTIVDADSPMNGCSAGNAGHITQANIFPPVSPHLLAKLPRMLLSGNAVAVRPAYALRMAAWLRHSLPTLRGHHRAAATSALASLSLPAFDELYTLAKSSNATELLHRDGVIYAFSTEEARVELVEAVGAWQEHGVAVDQLSGGQISDLEPTLRGRTVGGLFFRHSGRCSNPQLLGQRFARHFVDTGGQVERGRVTSIAHERDQYAITTTDGQITATDIVITAGFASADLLITLGMKVPLASERGYHLMLSDPGITLQRPVAFPEHHFIATPMDEGLRLAGTAEFSYPDAPPDFSRAHALLPIARKFLPAVRGEHASTWMGVRPSLPDGMPAIGELHQHPKLFYAFGHGHSGLTFAGVTASCVCSLISGTHPPIDMNPFDLRRFVQGRSAKPPCSPGRAMQKPCKK